MPQWNLNSLTFFKMQKAASQILEVLFFLNTDSQKNRCRFSTSAAYTQCNVQCVMCSFQTALSVANSDQLLALQCMTFQAQNGNN